MDFLKWNQYFVGNKYHFDWLDWNNTYVLEPGEKSLINSSISQFQRGEYSEGKHFLRFASSMNDNDYAEAVKAFIKEEQDHAIMLGKFMDIQGIARLKNDWLDNVFRRLRKLAGLEGTVTVLLTAEIISMAYYKALRAVTASLLLRQICKQILIDEEMHLRFQSTTLRVLYRRKTNWAIWISRTIHKTLMAGTIAIVWTFHHKIFRAGGYSFFSYSREVWNQFRRCDKMIGGRESIMTVSRNVNTAA